MKGKKEKKSSALRKNTLREILRTKSRFIAIFAIIGISVGFFSGLKSSGISMIATALKYFSDSHLMDLSLLSTVGFDDEDIEEIKNLEFVDEVMPAYASDLIITQNDIDSVVKVYSVPQKTKTNKHPLNEPVLKQGRLPKNEGECAIESYFLGMSGYKMGDTIKFNPSVEGRATTDIVRHTEYKIVGIVDSPLYLTYLRGNTTIGDGTVAFYMMIPPEEFAVERYTAVYVRTNASDGRGYELGDEYKELVDEQKKEIEKLSLKCVGRFEATTLADAQKKLNDARKEYEDKKTEALDEISKGEKKLLDGSREYYEQSGEAQKKLDDGEKELAEGREKLEKGQQDYKTGIEEGKKKLTEAQEQYNDGLAQYNKAKLEYDTQIDEAEKKLQSAQNEFDIQYQIFYSSTKPQAETKLTLLKEATDILLELLEKAEAKLNELRKSEILGEGIKAQISEQKKKIAEYKEKIAEYQQQYEEGKKLLEDGEKQINDAKEKLDAAKAELMSKKAEGALKLNEAKTQLDTAEGQLANGRLEYETALSTGMMELQAAQTQITEGEKKLEEGKKQLVEGGNEALLKIKQGREELAKGRYEAHVQLDDAEKKLSDAEEQLSSLENAKWYVNDRDYNPGYSGLSEDADRVDSISKVFPVFFLLIAGLVCFTTMTRMVEEHRTETGTLKALGYSNTAIAMKYIVYAGTAALLGSIVGGAAGLLTLPYIIVSTYGIMYSIPPTVLTINWASYIISSVTGIVCISLVSLFACFKDLRQTPAALMRPKAPRPGKRILLEYIKPLWNGLSFTSKVTARNLFRYKARFFMTIVGVAGCTALMVAALGLKDSTTDIADRQFNKLTMYDQIYSLSESGTAKDKEYIMSQFHADEDFENTLLANMSWGYISHEGHDNSMLIRFTIGEDQEQFLKMFILRDRVTHEPVPLTDEGIVITERTGEVYGIKEGDYVDITLDEEKYRCRVTGFTENYAGCLGYMTPEYYKKITGSELKYNVILTRLTEDSRELEREIANRYMKSDEIITVTSMVEQINTMMDMMNSLDFVIFVMFFCSGLLAVVVLYNLININIAERVREIATIKVLGFYSLETANFIYRESLVLTILGGLAGLGLGNVFATFIVESIQMDNVMFPKEVSWLSYLIAFIMTIVFSMIVNFMMYFKMNKISMVESLKSIE